MEGDPTIVKAIVMPLETITSQKVGEYLQEMHKTGLIRWYFASGKKYIEVKNWDTFQTFHGFHRIPSRFPSYSNTKSGASRTKRGANSTHLSAKEYNEVKEVNKEGLLSSSKALKAIGHKIQEGDE
jgi:hypothetical protein